MSRDIIKVQRWFFAPTYSTAYDFITYHILTLRLTNYQYRCEGQISVRVWILKSIIETKIYLFIYSKFLYRIEVALGTVSMHKTVDIH